jgi:hypothetical protein
MTFSVKEEDDVSKRHKDSRNVENVLVLQGGGSLGSFACGAVPYNNMNGLNRTMTSYKDYPEFSIFFIGANSCQDN